ncbi:hypothetical protein GIB67_026114 [Kingdonia uniflora]|uniref:DEP domain-containing protein n=1 Tax=Kingdonia uniflora TaxID=39325 RepID=A0A7J7M3A3_9MAGN|nr:hypothetical protein GIB67_026114 [Kingdonia uniflora]
MENEDLSVKKEETSPTTKKLEYDMIDTQKDAASIAVEKLETDMVDLLVEDQRQIPNKMESLIIDEEDSNQNHEKGEGFHPAETTKLEPENQEEANQSTEEIVDEEKEIEPVFDGTEIIEGEAIRSSSTHSLDLEPEAQSYAWPEKAVALKNFVKVKGALAVSTVLRRLSGKKDEDGHSMLGDQDKNDNSGNSPKDRDDSSPESETKEVSQKATERSTWNPLNYIKIARDVEQVENVNTDDFLPPAVMKGRILVYTRLGCHECKEVRLFFHLRRLRYVEINIDVYPSRKLELESYTGSSAVPKVFFNEVPIGGMSELKAMEESGELNARINDLTRVEPPAAAPLPPLSGEDDVSCSGTVDEFAVIVRKMRASILVKDRFYKMRRFSNCFLASECVDFLSEDQYLEREEAIEFGRKLVSKHFFRHVLEENVFEDGNHLYRFLDHDPIVMSQCYNIPRGIVEVKPKPIVEIASRLRFLSFAIFEAHTSEDGRHVDYRSIHGSEEFARYLRVVEELQRVELKDLSREEKLTFFINLYNMMAIHAILVLGYPVNALERRKILGDFKYVLGGCTYSLSAIQNGVLRANQRPPYNLIKPFGLKDPRSEIALSYPEPLVHFALVGGTRSGPALRCYSPGDIDKDLMEAARYFLRNGGVVINPETKVASVSKILRWYSADFGKNEVEVLRHAANYLEPAKSEELLELLANTQLKVIYQQFNWSLNC